MTDRTRDGGATRAALVIASLALVRCGPPVAACTVSRLQFGVMATMCAEITGYTSAGVETAFRTQCELPGAFDGMGSGTFTSQFCTRANVVAGCRRTLRSSAGTAYNQTEWYIRLSAVNETSVRQYCDLIGAEYVLP